MKPAPSASPLAGLGSFALLTTLLLSGCASPGTPRAPSLHLPEPVRNLAAERFGNHVDLHWTVPTQSTDHEPLENRRHSAGPLQAELCRATSPAAGCDVIAKLPVTSGQLATTTDELPASLQTGPLRPVFYRVRILNGAGRAAEGTHQAVAAAGRAPANLTGLTAATTTRGLQLTWHREPVVPGEQLLLRAETVGGAVRTKTAEPNPRHLNVPLHDPDSPPSNTAVDPAGTNAPPSTSPRATLDPGGTIDPLPIAGERVRYTVVRALTATLAGQTVVVNGEPATLTAIRDRDIFPPAVPTGLAAIAVQLDGTPPEIDLSWEPDTEPDLAGYYVYRAIDHDGTSSGNLARLTQKPVQAISYRDLQVAAGAHYRYAVTAVDRSGNESGHTPLVTERLRP